LPEYRPTIARVHRILHKDEREYKRARVQAQHAKDEHGTVPFQIRSRLMTAIDNVGHSLNLIANCYQRYDQVLGKHPYVHAIHVGTEFRSFQAPNTPANRERNHLTNFDVLRVEGTNTKIR
jgi:hypothetical protein